MARVVFRGNVTLAELERFTTFLETQIGEFGYVVTIADVSAAGVVSAEGRRFMSTWLHTAPMETIFISAGVTARAIITMIEQVRKLLRGKSPKSHQSHFVQTAEEAEKLVPLVQQRLRGQLSSR